MDWFDATCRYHEQTFAHEGRLSSLPEEWQRELAATWRLEADVNNGGYIQFLSNWGRESYAYASQALKKMGAGKMAEIIDGCQALVDEHFHSEGASHAPMQNLLPNPVIGPDGALIKEAGSILPDWVVDRISELSYEFMGYPEDIAKLGLKYYRPHLESSEPGANQALPESRSAFQLSDTPCSLQPDRLVNAIVRPTQASMRLLIGIYLLLGLAEAAMSAVMGYWAVRTRLAAMADRPRRSDHGEEVLLMASLYFVVAFLPLLVAYGLWKRWRLVRLVLLGVSWWSLAVCAFAIAVAFAMLAGLTDGRALGVHDPPGFTLALAGGISAFNGFQIWALMRRPTREAFRSRAKPSGSEPEA